MGKREGGGKEHEYEREAGEDDVEVGG
jgi:hypothetical protein